jgi:hypothetical protein
VLLLLLLRLPQSSKLLLLLLPHLMEVICFTTSAGECRSMRRLWILRASMAQSHMAGQQPLRCTWKCRNTSFPSDPQQHDMHALLSALLVCK